MSAALRGLRAALFIPDGAADASIAPGAAAIESSLRLLVLWRWAAHIWRSRTAQSRRARQHASATAARHSLALWRAAVTDARRSRRLDVKARFLRARSLLSGALAVWREARGLYSQTTLVNVGSMQKRASERQTRLHTRLALLHAKLLFERRALRAWHAYVPIQRRDARRAAAAEELFAAALRRWAWDVCRRCMAARKVPRRSATASLTHPASSQA